MIIVRKATSSDFGAIKKVVVDAWHSHFSTAIDWAHSEDRLDWYLDELEERFEKKNKGFVALSGKKIIGYINFLRRKKGNMFWVLDFVVKKRYQGKGAGRALMKALLDEATRLGHKKTYVITNSQNERAIAFYKKTGFEPTVRDIMMVKFLG